MPTHTIHSALTQMYIMPDCPGAPWNFSVWRELTGVRHGLFPADDDKLPKGWTRQTANEISSYFDQFRACMSEDEKIKFSSMTQEGVQMVPGRKAWRDWVTKLWKKAKMHEKIIEVLSAQNYHPYSLMNEEESPPSWPEAGIYVPLLIDPVGLALFGDECFSESGREMVRVRLRNPVKAIITRSWLTLYTNLNRLKKSIILLEVEAIQAFEGDFETSDHLPYLTIHQTWIETS